MKKPQRSREPKGVRGTGKVQLVGWGQSPHAGTEQGQQLDMLGGPAWDLRVTSIKNITFLSVYVND